MFTVDDAALSREWVEHLIGTSYIGLTHLVKKSYDADAIDSMCKIVDRLVEPKRSMSRFVGV